MIELVLAAALAVGDGAGRLPFEDRAVYWTDYFAAVGVLDDDERPRFFVYDWSFNNDLAVLAAREARVTAGTPPSLDRYRLPPPDWCYANYYLARDYARWLDRFRDFCHWGEQPVLDLIIDDVKWRRDWWLAAAGIDFCDDGRRLTLERLRAEIGGKDYLDSRWPDALPRVAFSHWWGQPLQEK